MPAAGLAPAGGGPGRAPRTRPRAPASATADNDRTDPEPGGTSDPSEHDSPASFQPEQVEFSPRQRSLQRPPASAGTGSSASWNCAGGAPIPEPRRAGSRAPAADVDADQPSKPFEQPASTPSTGGAPRRAAVAQQRVLQRAVVDRDASALKLEARRRSVSRRAAAATRRPGRRRRSPSMRNRTPTLVPVSVIVSPIAAGGGTRRLVVLGLDVRLRCHVALRRRRRTRARRASGLSRSGSAVAALGARRWPVGSGAVVEADVPESLEPQPATRHCPSTAIAPSQLSTFVPSRRRERRPRGRRSRLHFIVPLSSRGRGGQRERQGLAVRAGPQRARWRRST